jgi:cell division protein FtsW
MPAQHHAMERELLVWGDRPIVIAVAMLGCIGLLSVYATTGIRSGHALLNHQAIGLSLALVAAVAVTQFRLDFLLRTAPIWAALVALLFVLTLFTDFGVIKNGARRSMALGPVFLMPAELAKPAMVLLAARILTAAGGWSRQVLTAHVGLGLLVIGLMVGTKDLGTPVVIGGGIAVMGFLAGLKWRHVLILAAAGAGAITVLISIASHRLRYVRAWLDPYCAERTFAADPIAHRTCLDETNALRQSFQAVADGGWFGRALGGGQAPLHVMEGQNDFIGALIAEQFGLIGLLLIAVLFVVILWRGFALAASEPDRAIALLCAGATCLVAFQGLVHMAVVTGTIPPKGLTLPLVSSGTSSLIATGVLVGIIVSVARRRARRLWGMR